MNVGILGGGQLGRMLALAGYPLGLTFRFLDTPISAPVKPLARYVVGGYEDERLLDWFARDLDVVTYEFENVPVSSAQLMEPRVPVFPPPNALETAQDRLSEKTCFQSLGIPTPPFAAVENADDLYRAIDNIGLPAVLKTRRFGYDGKGQMVLRDAVDFKDASHTMLGPPLILEGFIPFEREVSLLAVRGRTGETAFYPLVENQHREGILRLSLAPAPDLTDSMQQTAQDYAVLLLNTLNYVGVLAIEFFVRDGQLIANEMAPRVHNSGHWTIEGAETSQFENHLRAVCGLPLGSCEPRGASAMLNIIGMLPDTKAVLAIPGAHLHLYGKTERAGRKLGHITLCAKTFDALEPRLDELKHLLKEN